MTNMKAQAKTKKRGERWLLSYTLILSGTHAVWLLCMLLSGRTLLCHSDALLQQYPTLCYTAQAVRDLLAGRGLRMVDLSLGQGMDALASLGFYGLTNPLYWPGALFTGRGLEVYYHFLVFLYRWLEGLAFALYLRRTGFARGKGWAIAAGSLMFACCGYNTAGILKCPYFAPGGICLCLALLGVERCLDDGKWGLLTLSALLSLLTNFYHGYSTLVMAAVYALARLAYRLPERGLKRVVREGLVLLGAALCGVLLSGFMLAPLLKAFMACARSGGASGYGESLLHWPWSYYRQLVADFFAPYGQARNWTQLSFLPWTAAGIAALFALGKGPRWARWLRAGLLLAVAGLCVPLAGRLFNGMSYAANRWSYGAAFVCCLAASAGLPALLDAGFARRRAVAAAMLAWAALMGIVALRGVDGAFMDMKLLGLRLSAWVVLFGAALLVCAAAWVLAWDARLRAGRTDARRAERFVSVTLALCCLAYTGGYGAAMFAGDEFYPMNLDGRIKARSEGLAAGLEGAFRVDTGDSSDSYAAMLGYHGTGYYYSIVPATVSDYYIDLQAPALRWVFQLRGLGADPYMSAVASVDRAVRPEKGAALLPYGFEGAGGGVYRNRYALPMGVFFTQTLSERTWKGLSPLQKRRALLSAAILEDAPDALSLPEAGALLPVTAEAGQGAELTENMLRGGAGDVAALSYDAPEDCLAWLWIRDPALVSGGNASYLQVDTRDDADARGAFNVPRPDGNYFFSRDGVFLYLGQGRPGRERLALRLESAAELSFSDMAVVTLPASEYEGAVQALSERGGWSPELGTNRLSGRYEAPTGGVLQISVPFSEGWRARVDGTEVPVLRCGGMYMGIALEPGGHDIELRYVTPGLIPGALATLAGLLLAVGLRWLTSKRK